jgi:hypothetical protein
MAAMAVAEALAVDDIETIVVEWDSMKYVNHEKTFQFYIYSFNKRAANNPVTVASAVAETYIIVL